MELSATAHGIEQSRGQLNSDLEERHRSLAKLLAAKDHVRPFAPALLYSSEALSLAAFTFRREGQTEMGGPCAKNWCPCVPPLQMIWKLLEDRARLQARVDALESYGGKPEARIAPSSSYHHHR